MMFLRFICKYDSKCCKDSKNRESFGQINLKTLVNALIYSSEIDHAQQAQPRDTSLAIEQNLLP